jgi:hypothetical protein
MEGGAWIIAAWMVQRHGANAFRAVEAKLEKMRRDGINEDHFRRWCWVAGAVIEIITEPYDAKLCTEPGARPSRSDA